MPGFIDARKRADWPEVVPPGVRAYLTAVAGHGPRALVANARARALLLRADDAVLPVLVPDARQPADPAAFLVPTVHHVEYPRRTYMREGRLGASAPLSALRRMLRAAGLDRVVYLNHWLATGAPSLPDLPLPHVLDLLRTRFPDRAIVVPDIVPDLDTDTVARLESQGGRAVPTRMIRVLDPARPLVGRRFRTERNNRNQGLRLLDEAAPRAVPCESLVQHAATLAALYRASYIGRHSPLNPDYTPAFFTLLLGVEPVRAKAWVAPAEAARGITAFSIQWLGPSAIVWSAFGRDPCEPDDWRSYELALARDVAVATASGVPLRWGAGADSFKRNRGAVKHLQVEMVFADHLPAVHRGAWRLLQGLRTSRFTDTGKR